MDPRSPMAREPDTTKPIAWYAYQDGTTNREYYHEPNSGETSWVLPTSLNRCSTNYDTMMGVGGNTDNNDNVNVQGVHKNFTGSSRLRQFCVVGGAVIFILLFNTLFLLVVTRVIADDDGIVKIINMYRGQALPLPPSSQVGNGSHQHYLNDIIVDAMVAATSTDNPSNLPAPDDGVQQRDNSVISNYSTTHDDTHVLGGKDITVESTQNIYINNNDSIHPPMNCWIPFSYIIVGKCRRHAREGLLMPLADASSMPLI